MNVGSAGSAQVQPQGFQYVKGVTFDDDAGRTYKTFSGAGVPQDRVADTNSTRKGFGIDLNGDGRFDRNNDGYLALDFDGDGKYSAEDIQRTNSYLKAIAGDEDFDGDGRVSFREKSEANSMRKYHGSLDLDQDGVVSGWELSDMGAQVVKLSRDGDQLVSTIHELPGFEKDRPSNQPSYLQPQSSPQYAEFQQYAEQWRQTWSNMLGIDLNQVLGSPPAPGQPAPQPNPFAGQNPFAMNMFGNGGFFGGNGFFGGF